MRSILTILSLFILITLGHTQNNMIIPQAVDQKMAVHQGSNIQKTPCAGTINALGISSDWGISIRNYGAFNHTAAVDQKQFKDFKIAANARRQESHEDTSTKLTTTEDAPALGNHFRGNMRGTGVPMDNSMAISKNGFIVSTINSNVIFTNPAGDITYTKGFPDFFTLLSLGTRMYDPRVIYDVEANRFIFMCLHGSEPANTFLCIAFSKTEDPNGEWHYYKIDGNPSGDDRWFDYPNIGLSKKDFYIAGLMRDTPGDWQYSVLYQIDKNDGYNGQELQWKYYNDLKDADGQPSFNLVPAISGWDDLTAPGMYFVSNSPNGGDTYNLYYTDGALDDNPKLTSLQTKGYLTELAPDGRQKNTTNVLNTFDSRIWSAMYLDGTVHMGSHVNTPKGDVGLFYGRMDVGNLQLHVDVLTTDDIDYGFPSFSAFGDQSTDKEILVNYLYSGPDIFPGQQQRVCSGSGTEFNWSEPTTLKTGQNYVNALSDDNERWGDYTTSCRRFFDGRVESWVTGCFGEGSSYGTWLGQYFRAVDTLSTPMPDFTSDLTTTAKNTKITFKDITKKNPTSWQWIFEGGTPNISTEKNPEVIYASDGAYDVKLIVTNSLGTDTIIKNQYIHIQDPVARPIADFIVGLDTIFKDDNVSFTSQSSANTVNHRWTFPNGVPGTSTEVNPTVRYSKTGSYLVSLTVANIAGTNTKTVPKAITVINRTQPEAAFATEKQNILEGAEILFTDQSKGGPRQWFWQFEGGIPAFSEAKNPVVKYPIKGVYPVKLKVINEIGTDSIMVEQYINVGVSSTLDIDKTSFTLYPNPAKSDAHVTLKWEASQKEAYKIVLSDIQGQLIKTLYDDRVKSGLNELYFKTTHLNPGTYVLKIHTATGLHRSVKMIVIE